jgi:hypothetical protein
MTSAQTTSAAPAHLVTHYETLRRAALGDALPPEARVGLTLFLRRGMWGWARTIVTTSAVLQPADARPAQWQPPEEDRTLIHLLAALAIKVNHEGDSA